MISVAGRTAMLVVLLISVTRYSDMLAARSRPRTTIVTDAAYLARWIAAWPAELPAPTTNTSWPTVARASAPAAP